MNMSNTDNSTIRCGTDLADIDRIRRAAARLGQPFLDRLFTAGEQADCLPEGRIKDAAIASLAARFAAKEAVGKALGTGIWQQGVAWTDISVQRQMDGQPSVVLCGAALAAYRRLGGRSIAISLTHEKNLAMAFCVIVCQPDAAKDKGHE
jgi:holo-[acyl-carrier protein] synthase